MQSSECPGCILLRNIATRLRDSFPDMYKCPSRLLGSSTEVHVRGRDWGEAADVVSKLSFAEMGELIACNCTIPGRGHARLRPWKLHYFGDWDARQYADNQAILKELATGSILAYLAYAYSDQV